MLKIIDCGYSLEPPRRGGSNEYPQSITFSLKHILYMCVFVSFDVTFHSQSACVCVYFFHCSYRSDRRISLLHRVLTT